MKKRTDKKEMISEYIHSLKDSLDKLSIEDISSLVSLVMDVYRKGKTIFIMGNGGSASTASHMSCDLNKGTLRRHYDEKEKRLRVISLTDNTALLTAYANDLSYEDIFVQQLKNLVGKGDLVIAISASGDSINCIRAVEYARKRGARTAGLLGFGTGGKLARMVNTAVIVDSRSYGICEDIHLILDHIITVCVARMKEE